MRNLVIVEGPDCSGKSTLAKKIACKLGMVYVHLSGHPSLHGGMTAYHAAVLDFIDWNIRHNNKRFVIDRLWQSELVYVPVLRPHMDGVYESERIREMIAPHRPITVLCMDDDVVQRHELEQDRNHPYPLDVFKQIVDGYRLLMEVSDQDENVLHYDLTQPGRDDEIIQLIDTI